MKSHFLASPPLQPAPPGLSPLLLLCNQRKLCSPMWARRRGMEIYSASFSLLIGITWKGKSFKASTVVIYEDGEISVSNKPFSLIQSQYIVVVEVTTNYNNARCVWQKKREMGQRLVERLRDITLAFYSIRFSCCWPSFTFELTD